MGNIATLNFKYRGVVDWNALFAAARNFWLERDLEIQESKYKDKSNEFEGNWKIEHKMDAYRKAIYEIEFKAFEMSPIVKDGKTLYNGRMYFIIEGSLEENYGEASIAGKKEIFQEESWLHKIYKKVTYRDTYEKAAGDVVVTAHNFQNLLKSMCNMDAK